MNPTTIIGHILDKFNFTGVHYALVAMGKTLQTESGVSYHPDISELRERARGLLEGATLFADKNQSNMNIKTFTTSDDRICLKATLHIGNYLELQFIPFETAQNVNQKN